MIERGVVHLDQHWLNGRTQVYEIGNVYCATKHAVHATLSGHEAGHVEA
jgi:hypothetical protein